MLFITSCRTYLQSIHRSSSNSYIAIMLLNSHLTVSHYWLSLSFFIPLLVVVFHNANLMTFTHIYIISLYAAHVCWCWLHILHATYERQILWREFHVICFKFCLNSLTLWQTLYYIVYIFDFRNASYQIPWKVNSYRV